MLDASLRVVSTANVRGEFISSEAIDRLQKMYDGYSKRINVVNRITAERKSIIRDAVRTLFAEQPQLITPGGNAYPNRRMAVCLRDLEIILRYITYALYLGDASVLEDRCLNGLRETYAILGVPSNSFALAVQRMKEISLNFFIKPESKKENQVLTITEIQKLYPKQWVIIEISQFKDGFPSGGEVLFYDHDLDNLADEASQLSGNIYTFFTGAINEKSAPLIEEYKQDEITFLTSDYSDILQELTTYFDRVIAALF